MKQNVSETESNWGFRKNLKTCSQNKKSYLMLPLMHVHFHPILIKLPCKYYCPLVVNPTITNCCKELHHVAEFLHAPLKTLPRTKTSPISWENRSFFLLFRNVATFIESHCVFLLLFTV